MLLLEKNSAVKIALYKPLISVQDYDSKEKKNYTASLQVPMSSFK